MAKEDSFKNGAYCYGKGRTRGRKVLFFKW